MKTKLFCLCAGVAALLAPEAGAQITQFWDNNGTSTPSSGTWDNTSHNWAPTSTATTSTGPFTNGNSATFTVGTTGISSLTVTVNSVISLANLTNTEVTNLTFSGSSSGALALVGPSQAINCGPSGSDNILIDIPLTGPSGIVQHNSGALSLYGTNTYSGGTTLTGGQIIYYNNGASFGTGAISNTSSSGALVNSATSTVTITNEIVFTGDYSLNMAGGGPFSGAPGTIFSGNFSMPSGATPIETSSSAQLIEISGIISGTGANVTVADVGSLILAGNNTYTGGTQLGSSSLAFTGTLYYGNAGALGAGTLTFTNCNGAGFTGYGPTSWIVTNAVATYGAMSNNFSNSAPMTFTGPWTLNTGSTFSFVNHNTNILAGAIGGAGALTLEGTGVLDVATNNSFSGATTVGSPLVLGFTNGSFGTGTLTLATAGSGATLAALGAQPVTVTNAVSVSGTTTITLSNNSAPGVSAPVTFTGPWNLGSATLTIDNVSTNYINGDIAGTVGALVLSGAGEVSLAGVNSYALGTTVNSGVLLDINTTGSVAGNITVNSGGQLELDNAAGMAPQGTPLGTLNLPASPAAGMVNLNFTGMDTILAINVGGVSLAPGTWGGSGSGAANINAAFTGSGILNVVISSAPSDTSYWDPNHSDAAPGSGGSGTWDNVTSDWFTGSLDTPWATGTVAEFAGAAGTVTLATNVIPDAITFETPGYAITSTGTGNLMLDNPFTPINVPAGTATIAAPISGQGAVISGPGTLVLGGNNTFTNTTYITNSAVVSAAAIADSPNSSGLGYAPLVLAGGSTLLYTGASPAATARFITNNGTQTGYINVPGSSGALTLSGRVLVGTDSSAQALTKTGTGTLIFAGSGDNSSLTVAVNQGELIIDKTSASSAHGLGGGTSTVASGAELQLSGSGSYDLYSGCILTIASGGLFDVNGQSDDFSTLTLSGNGFGSGVVINSAAGTTASLTNGGSAVVLAGPTTVGGAGNISLYSVVSGDYPLTYAGSGVLTLFGANTFNGGLYLAPGATVLLTNSGNTAAGTGPIVMGANSVLNVANIGNSVAIGNPIVGPSTATVFLKETAADNLQVNSDMSAFTGTMVCPPTPGTTAKAQLLSTAFTINPSATIVVSNGGTLYVANPYVMVDCLINVYGTGNSEAYGALRVENNCLISGPVILYGNTTMGNGQSGATKAADISGAISGAFGIQFEAEPGIIVLSGANTYTGNTTWTGSIVQLASPELGNSGPLGEPSSPAGTLIFKGGCMQFTAVNTYDYSTRFSSSSTAYIFDENGQTVTFASPIAGTATLVNGSSTPNGSGTLIMAAANTYTGVTTLSNDTVQLNAVETAGTSGPLGNPATVASSIVLDGGTLQFTPVNTHDYSPRFSSSSTSYSIDVNGQNVTFANALAGSGSLSNLSTIPGGTLTLMGSNTFTGTIYIELGSTLVIGGNGSLGYIAAGPTNRYAGAIYDFGALNFATSSNILLTGSIFGGGSLAQTGAGTTILSNAETYYGGTTVSAGKLDVTNGGSILGSVTATGGVLELDNTTALQPNAVLTLSNAPAAGAVVLNYSGTLTINALNFGSAAQPTGTYGAVGTAAQYQSTTFSGTGILNVVSGSDYWDPSLSDAAPGSGGSGTWNSTTGNWFNGTADTTWTAGNIPTFAGASGTVTLGANETVDGLFFESPSNFHYTINGASTLTLSGAAGNSTPFINILSGTNTINCVIASGAASNSVIISGPGTLVLDAANTFTNPVFVTGGATLSLNSLEDSGPSALGPLGVFGNNSTNILTIANANLTFTGPSGDTARNVELEGNSPSNAPNTLTVPVGSTLEFDGRVYENTLNAGYGLTFKGGGTLIFGPSPFNGAEDNGSLGLNILAGTVIINKNSSSGAHGLGGVPTAIGSNAVLQLSGSGNYDLYSACTLYVSNGAVLDLGGQSDSTGTFYVAGNGSGNGAIINSGYNISGVTNTSILLTGNTTIGGATTTASIYLASAISAFEGGYYSLTYAAQDGMLELGGANTFQGGLNLDPNTTVELTVAGGAGTGAVSIGSGSTLIVNNALTIANNIVGGANSTIQVNATSGNSFLTGSLSGFDGTVMVEDANGGSGQLVINNINDEAYPINSNATWNLQAGATVDLATPFTNDPAAVVINGLGNDQAYGSLRLDACNQQGNVLLQAYTCLIGSGNSGGPCSISGVISDGGGGSGFTFVGSSSTLCTLILNAVNTYSGPTVVSNGTLAIGASGSIASSSFINLAPGTTFDVSRVSGAYSIGSAQTLGTIGGAATINGSLALSAGATLNLTNTGSTPITVNNGTLTLNNNPLNLIIPTTVTPGANGYLLIAAGTGGAVAGSVASATVTVNGAAVNPATIFPQIINGSLYLSATSPQIFAGPTPANPTIFTNGSVTLSAVVFGANPLTNQWYLDGAPIAGATNTSVTIHGATLTPGTYTALFGSTNSFSPTGVTGSTTLTVLAEPAQAFPQAVLALKPIGYWRLNEPEQGNGDDGVVCHDYVFGNDGLYTNTVLGNLGYDSIDANVVGDTNYDSETSAYFGYYSPANSCAYGIPIDLSSPTNTSATFSVQAWVQAPTEIFDSINTPGVVGKGLYDGEEFTIDCGQHISINDAYRFEVRNAGATSYNANSALLVGVDTNWHFLVGVCDEVHTNLAFYIDGTNVANVYIPSNSGICSTYATFPMSIGARSSVGTSYDQQFTGDINDVAIYTNALTAAQVQNLYFTAGIPPSVATASNSLTVNEYGTAVMPSFPYGSPSLSLQWYVTDNNNTTTPIAGQTNATLTLNNALASYAYVEVVVTNAFGATTSAPVTLTVNTGGAYVDINPEPALVYVPVGTFLSYSVVAYGADPIYYQWYLNYGTGGQVTIGGATNASFTLAALAGTNTYTCAVSNAPSGSWSAGSSVTVVGTTVPPVVNLNNNSLWSLQGTGFTPTLTSGILELTSSAGSEAGSAFYEIPQYMSNGFQASYIYTPSSGSSTRADGTTFVIQNSTSFANPYQALGADGGDLGVVGISPCVNFNLDLYTSAPGGTGINWETNGLTAQVDGLPNGGTGSVNINSLDPIKVTITYNGSNNVQVVLEDTTSLVTYTTNYTTGNLAGMLGSVDAYVGFTAGTGGSYVEQQISDFSYIYTTANEGPVLLSDLAPTNMQAPVGASITYSVNFAGTAPLYYQWYLNGTNNPISGAASSSYSFGAVAGTNTYQCGVSNAVGGSVSVYSSVATVVAAVSPPVISLSNSSLWQLQGTSAFTPTISDGVLTTTTAAGSESTSAYYTIPQYIDNGFVVSFTFTPSGGTSTRADGTAFVLQDAPSGPFALGIGGGGLGVDGTSPAVNLDLDLYSGATGGTGISWQTNGTTAQEGGAPNAGTGSLNINSLDPIGVTITYHPELANVQVNLSDSVGNVSYVTNYPMTIPLGNLTGGQAVYLGFTGGTGSDDANQTIRDLAFSYVGPAAAVIQDISPASFAGYVGASATFTVLASGEQPITYLWYVNSILVASNSTGTLTTTVPSASTTSVQCGVSNSYNVSPAMSGVATIIGVALPTDAYATNLLFQDPIAYWRLNEPYGTTIAHDYVGGFNGTYGADTLNGEPGIPNPPFTGLPLNDLGVLMDNNVASSAGFVTTPSLNTTLSNATLTCWVYPHGNQSDSAGLVFSRGSTVDGINYGANNEMAYTWNNNSATYDWTSGLVIPTNQWSFLALAISPSGAAAYVINASGLSYNSNDVANPSVAITSGFDLGADPQASTLPARIFNGEMDEVAIFGTTLSSNQVVQMFANADYTTAAPPPPTISIEKSGGFIVLTWSAGDLLSTTNLSRPWTLVTNAVSPYAIPDPASPVYFTAGVPYNP